jgi:hypothetical protein
MQKEKQSGTALLITMLVITVIGVVGFGMGRLMLGEVQMVGSLEDSYGALQAAEAGIEDGLLRWRYDHNVEVHDLATGNHPTHEPGDVSGPFNVGTTGSYDLKVWFREKIVGDMNNDGVLDEVTTINPNYPHTALRDQAIEVLMGGSDDQRMLTLCLSNTIKPIPGGNPVEATPAEVSDAKVEYIPIGEDGTISSAKLVEASRLGSCVDYPEAYKVRFKIWISPSDSSDMTGYYVQYGYTSTDPNVLVDSGITYIESTGTFGTAKRKLRVEVDRNSGRILGFFDFILYAGKGSISLF